MARKWWTLIAVCTGVFMLLLDVTIVNVALPQIERALQREPLRPAVGDRRLRADAGRAAADRRIDCRPRRPPTRVRDRDRRLHARLGALRRRPELDRSCRCRGRSRESAARSCSRPRWRCWRRRSRRVSAASPFAVFGAITGVAVAVGPVLGGAITSGLSWRWIFFVNVPIGVAGAGRDAAPRRRVEAAGAPRPDCGRASSRFSLALAGLVFGLIRSQADGWGSATVLGSLIARGRAAGRVRA